MIGLTKSESHMVCKKRKESPLHSLDDLKDMIGDEKFKKLKLDDIIF